MHIENHQPEMREIKSVKICAVGRERDGARQTVAEGFPLELAVQAESAQVAPRCEIENPDAAIVAFREKQRPIIAGHCKAHVNAGGIGFRSSRRIARWDLLDAGLA